MIRYRKNLLWPALGAVAAFGCGGGDDGDDGGSNVPTKPSFTRVTKEVITFKTCGGPLCHDSSAVAGFALGSRDQLHATLVGQKAAGPECATSGLDRVVPGDPDSSLLYLKLSSAPPCGEPMPLMNPLEVSQVELVRQWIAEGAKND